jgi:hypothetical protein
MHVCWAARPSDVGMASECMRCRHLVHRAEGARPCRAWAHIESGCRPVLARGAYCMGASTRVLQRARELLLEGVELANICTRAGVMSTAATASERAHS